MNSCQTRRHMYIVLSFCIYLGVYEDMNDMNVAGVTVLEFHIAVLTWKCSYCT